MAAIAAFCFICVAFKTSADAGFARMVVSFFFAGGDVIPNSAASEMPSFYK
jgi:hypothetical protein